MLRSIIISAFLASFSNISYSLELNQRVEILARSFPIGGFSKYTLELIKPLWGEKDHVRDITYGFFGAQAEFRTSVIVNYIAVRGFVYPLPILGIFAGAESGIKKIRNIDTFNCDQFLCDGKMKREYIGLKLALGHKKFFFMSENKYSQLTPDMENRLFVDEITTLLGTPKGDNTFVSLNIVGLRYSDHQKFGLIFLSNRMKKNKSQTEMLNFFYEHSWKQHSLISSAGIFETRQRQKVATILFLYSWKTPSSLRLF